MSNQEKFHEILREYEQSERDRMDKEYKDKCNKPSEFMSRDIINSLIENKNKDEIELKINLIINKLADYDDVYVLQTANKLSKILDSLSKSDILSLCKKRKLEKQNKELSKDENNVGDKLKKHYDMFEEFASDFIQDYPCYYDKNNILFGYDIENNKWNKSDERDLINIAKNMMKQSGLNNSQVRASFINAILDKARWQKPEDVPKNWIHFNNCFYDIESNTRIEPERKYFSQIKIPHKLGLSEETPIIDEHIKSWVGEDQYKLFLQICAYCMYKDYPFARFFIFYGTGQDGKSTAGEFISRLIGYENRCMVNLDQLEKNRFESQKMYQKTLAVCGEVDYNLLKNTRQLKGCTGGDPLTIEFKNKDPFTYNNFAKLLWYANGVPPTYDKTQGFYRRTIIIKFGRKFKENSNPLGNITEEEYENFCLKCMFVLKDLLENGFDEKSLEDKTRIYEELSNPILKFLELSIEKDASEEDYIILGELYKSYSAFAKKKSYRNFQYRDFTAMIRAEGYEIKQLRFYRRIDNEQLDRKKDDLFVYEDKDIRRECIIGCSWEVREPWEVKNESESHIENLSENRVPRIPLVPKQVEQEYL